MTPIAARVGGTVLRVDVSDNQGVEAGDRAGRDRSARLPGRASTAPRPSSPTREADGAGRARAAVPITSTPASSGNVSSAQGRRAGRRQRRRAKAVEAALHAAHRAGAAARGQARRTPKPPTGRRPRRRAAARPAREGRDSRSSSPTPRSRPRTTAQAPRASARAAGGRSGNRHRASRESQRRAGRRPASGRRRPALRSAQTAPVADAGTPGPCRRRRSARPAGQAALAQAELNLEYTAVKAPASGIVSRKSGRGRTDRAARTAAARPGAARRRLGHRQFQGDAARRTCAPGQRRTIAVDAFGGTHFEGTWTASRRRPARASACCRPRTRPATSSRSCSACR